MLVVSPDTVRTHVSRAMVELHARDRAQLVVFAMESGLAAAGAASSRPRAHHLQPDAEQPHRPVVLDPVEQDTAASASTSGSLVGAGSVRLRLTVMNGR